MQQAIGVRTEPSIVLNKCSDGPVKHTILLVEDEDMVRALLCEVLARVGYEVLACADPAEGIETCLRHSGQIDLLLTDVVMPGMNGREMANRILEILPELRVVFMSGYTEQVALQQEGHLGAQVEYLQKPFTLKALTQKMERILGNNAESL